MPRLLGRKMPGYCQRTGFKVPYNTLVPDGETGQLVEEGWEDREHPQKYLPPIDDHEQRAVPGVLMNIEPQDDVSFEPLVLDSTGSLVEE